MLADKDIYITLPSNGDTKTYPENHPGKFKARLPQQILLPRDDWEVALASVSFLSVSLSASSVYDDVNYDHLVSKDLLCGIELNLDAQNARGDKIGSVSYWLRGSQVKDEYRRKMSIRLASRHGVDFWNRMLALLYYKLNTSSPKNYTVKRDYRDGYRVKVKWPELQWENAGSVYRLKINNEGVINGDYTTELENAFLIHLDVAKFNLVIPKKYGSGYQLTSLVTVEHFRDPMDHVKFVGDVQHLWAVAGGPGSGFNNEGVINGDYTTELENAFLIHLDVAKFNLVIPKKYGSGYQLTSLVTVEHFRDPMDHVKFVGDVQHLWAVAGGPGSGFHPEGPPSDSYYLKLSCAVNWYL